ncbi:MAG: hypothetical protein QXS23_05885 [Desulfurococcaceae archaeon]
MIIDVIEEILGYRLIAPNWVKTKRFMAIKIALIFISAILPYLIDPLYVTLWLLFVISFTYLLGLRKTVIYATLSVLLLFSISLLPIALILGGDVERVIRSSMTAYATMLLTIFLIASTPPSTFKEHSLVYLFLIIITSVFREVVDISVIMKSKGLSGLKYYASVITTSFVMTFERIEQLTDSLRVRGIEII